MAPIALGRDLLQKRETVTILRLHPQHMRAHIACCCLGCYIQCLAQMRHLAGLYAAGMSKGSLSGTLGAIYWHLHLLQKRPRCVALSWSRRRLTEKLCLQIWKYQPWLRTMLLGVLQELQATEKPIIAIHVKAHGSTPVQVRLPAVPDAACPSYRASVCASHLVHVTAVWRMPSLGS